MLVPLILIVAEAVYRGRDKMLSPVTLHRMFREDGVEEDVFTPTLDPFISD